MNTKSDGRQTTKNSAMARQREIVVGRTVLANFRRRALARYPLEYIEAVYGKITNKSIAVVELRRIENQEATRSKVEWDDEDIERDGPLRFLGTIHTHPDCSEASPSEHDWKYAVDHRDVLFGICAIEKRNGRRSARIVFYESRKPYHVTKK